ncbi:MAG: M56 family metallopeptidase [Lachnospiraceae bacterium]
MFILSDKLNLFLRCIIAGAFFLLPAALFLFCTQKKLKKSGYIRFLYVFMILSAAGAGILFLVGVISLFLPVHIFLNRWTFWLAGWKAASGNKNFPFVFPAGAIWAAGVIRCVFEYRKKKKTLDALYLLNRPVADVQVQNCFFYAAEKTELKRIPLLFSNEAVKMPFVKGILSPAVIIPVGLISSHEQMLTFAHELTHCKRHDLLLRRFQKMMLAVYWFVPIRFFWMESFIELQETLCDIDVCRSYGEHFSARTYYMTILTMSEQKAESMGNHKNENDGWTVSGLLGHAGQLEQRIGNMLGYRSGNRNKGLTAAMTAAGSMLFLINILAGICWPDIPANQNGEIQNIDLDIEAVEICADAGFAGERSEPDPSVSGKTGENSDTTEKAKEKELKWEQDIVYHLAPGETIGSENFRGREGDTLILMTVASEGGYEIRLVSGEIPVFTSIMDDRECLNLELQDRDYRLLICNPGDSDIRIELYCAR